MPKNIHVRIDNPCAENWDQMRPEEQGRFCSSCRKTVVDFSVMSDQEVLSWLTRSSASVCGHFYNDQLNRNLVPPPAKKGRWVTFWQLLLAGLLVSSEASAQSPAARVEVIDPHSGNNVQGDPQPFYGSLGAISISRVEMGPLRGQVVDSLTDQPLSGTSIQLGNSGKSFSTDKEGRFRIDRKLAAKYHTLNITRVGYKPLAIPLDQGWLAGIEKTIPMSIISTELPTVIVVGYGTSKGKIAVGGAMTIVKADSFPQKILDSLAVVGLAKKALTVYPNPVVRGSSVTLSIRLDNPGVYSAQLYSASGALIETLPIEEKATTALMNIPATLAAGVYFVKLSHPLMNKVYTQQLLVQ